MTRREAVLLIRDLTTAGWLQRVRPALLLLPETAEVFAQSPEAPLGDNEPSQSPDKSLQDLQEVLYETLFDLQHSMMDVARGFGGLGADNPAAHGNVTPEFDVFGFLGVGANVPLPGYSQGVERQSVLGFGSDEGPYVGLIKAKGERFGTSETYLDHYKGTETLLTSSGITNKGITFSGVGTGLEVPFLAGAGVGVGTYGSMGHRGLYVAGSVEVLGTISANLGFGFQLF